MPTSIVINGTSYDYPVTGDDTDWGGDATDWASAVSLYTLQPNASSFPMTAETDFGASFGFKLAYIKSRAANPAAAGIIRLGNTQAVSWRNFANGADLPLSVDASDRLTYNGNVLSSSSGIVPVASGGTGISSYTAGDTLYASGTTTLSKLTLGVNHTVYCSNGTAPQWQTLTNNEISASAAIVYSKLSLSNSILNADINSAAAIAYSKLNLATSILNADISASAAIAFSKLAALTSAHILVGSGSNVATDVAVSGDVSLTNAGVTALVATSNGTLVTLSAAAGVAVHGTNTNDSASAGFVGQLIAANPGANVTPAATNSGKTITSISLTAGDWDVDGFGVVSAGVITGTRYLFAISLTTDALDSTALGGFVNIFQTITQSSAYYIPTGTRRISVSGTTTVYLVGLLTYSVLGVTEYTTDSYLRARRVR